MNTATFWLGLFLFIFAVGLAGWCAWHCFFRFPLTSVKSPASRPMPRLAAFFFLFLSGVVVISPVLLLLGYLGCLTPLWLGLFFVLILFVYLMKVFWLGPTLSCSQLSNYLVFLLILSLAVTGFLLGAKPMATVAYTTDASFYVGAGHYLADKGTLRYEDALAEEMSPEERRYLFKNSYVDPSTLHRVKVRLQSSVLLYDGEKLESEIGFFPLFPLWLALGTLCMGSHGFLAVMSLIAVLNLFLLFMVGALLGGQRTGFALALCTCFFFPQLYYFLMPLSETFLQLLLLSGLCILCRLTDEDHGIPLSGQLLVSLLWGAAFFTKIEVLFLLPLCLMAAFTLVSPLRKRVTRWTPLILLLALFFFLAIHLQFSRGTYFTQIFNWLTHTGLAKENYHFLGMYPGKRGLLFLLIWIFLAGGLFLARESVSHRIAWVRARTVVMVIFLCCFLGLFIKLRFNPHKFQGVLDWLFYYLDPFALGLAGGGILLNMLSPSRQNMRVRLVLVFFAVPACIYLIDPMVHPNHPFAIRRFVPLFLPLLFALSLSGWRIFCDRLITRRYGAAGAAFLLMAVLCIQPMSREVRILLGRPQFSNLIAQVEKTVRPIPQNALIILPLKTGNDALQVAIQYLMERDVLVLALTDCPILDDRHQVLFPYLKRQVENRRVFAILNADSPKLGRLCDTFSLHPVGQSTIAFSAIVEQMHFNPEPVERRYDYCLYELGTGPQASGMVDVDIGDPATDLPYLREGFYLPERRGPDRYRWTDGQARLKLPWAEKIRLTLMGPGAWVEIFAGGVRQHRIEALGDGMETVTIALSGEPFVEEPALDLEIRSATFLPAERGSPGDSRTLGINLFRVETLPSD